MQKKRSRQEKQDGIVVERPNAPAFRRSEAGKYIDIAIIQKQSKKREISPAKLSPATRCWVAEARKAAHKSDHDA